MCVTGGLSDEHLLSVQMSDPQHNTAGQRHLTHELCVCHCNLVSLNVKTVCLRAIISFLISLSVCLSFLFCLLM